MTRLLSEVIKQCMDAGMNDVLGKPINQKKLINVVAKYCR